MGENREKPIKKEDFQAYIDFLVQEYDIVDYSEREKRLIEKECHIDVDVILSESVSNFKKYKNNKSHKLHPQNHSHHVIHSHIPSHVHHVSNIHNHNHNYSHVHYAHHGKISHPRRENLISNLHEENKRKKNKLGTILLSMFA